MMSRYPQLTYEQTIEKLGEQSFHHYMGGGSMPYTPAGTWIVAEIYGVPLDDVEEDIDIQRNDLINQQALKHQKPVP